MFVKVSHLSAAPSEDVTSFDWFMFVMSRVCQGVPTLRQHPVKMAHLLTGSCSSCHVCVKVSHLLAAPSQDGTSFDWFMFVMSRVCQGVPRCGSTQSRWHIIIKHIQIHFKFVTSCVCQGVVISHVFVKVSHLSAAPSEDVTSFDWFMFVMSRVCQGVPRCGSTQSRWHIF